MGGTRKTFEADATTIDEEKTFAGCELTDDIGGKDLFRLGVRADMEGCMDGRAKQSTFQGHRFACMQADAHADGVVRVLPIMLCKALLDRHCACDSAGGGQEGRFNAISSACRAIAPPKGKRDRVTMPMASCAWLSTIPKSPLARAVQAMAPRVSE